MGIKFGLWGVQLEESWGCLQKKNDKHIHSGFM